MSMVPFQSWLRKRKAGLAASLLCFASPMCAIQAPAGTEINLRLKTKVSTATSKVKDPVEAMVIQPVLVEGQFVIPAGAAVLGVVADAKRSTGPDDRAMLEVVF